MTFEPTNDEVNQAIASVALQSLEGKPVGSIAMVNEVIGYKKMPFWWTVRALGIWVAIKGWWKDYRINHLGRNA